MTDSDYELWSAVEIQLLQLRDAGSSRLAQCRPLEPSILADALQDRVHPASGRLLAWSRVPKSRCSS